MENIKLFKFTFRILFVIFSVLLTCNARLFFINNVPDWTVTEKAKTSEDKLKLTTLINDGDDSRARKLARVDKELFLNVLSYSGYLTVDDECNSNMWFWFFPAEGTYHLYDGDRDDDDDDKDDECKKRIIDEKCKKMRSRINSTIDYKNENKPLVLWLQGGPGSSSLFGLFTENGPFFINDDLISIKKNENSWTKNVSMLYFDNPVGTGFSFTDPNGYVETVDEAGDHLYNALEQFLKMFPWLQEVPFYITGESFAGKYIPVLATKIDNGNSQYKFKINLKGLAIGNAFIDPKNMLKYSEMAWQMGLVDRHGYNEMKLFEILTKENIDQPLSKIYFDYILETFLQHSNYRNLYNILQPDAIVMDPYLKYVNQVHIRRALHVGNQEFASPYVVYYNLAYDFMTSAMSYVDKLLDKKYRIMLYSGNLDFIVAYPLSTNTYNYMKWNGSEEHKFSERQTFYTKDKKLAGYIKKTRNFYEVTVLNAGHMVPTDQPVAMLKLINMFISGDI